MGNEWGRLIEKTVPDVAKSLFVCLVFNGTSTQDRSMCANCGRVKPTQLAKDGQRDTMHNSQYVTRCNTVHNRTLQLQKCNNRLSNHMTYLLNYYVSAFTNTKSDHTLPIRYSDFTRWDAVLRHAQDIVWQFTLLHIAQCHDKKSEYCQIFFPCTGSGQQYAHRQETIDTTVLSPHGAWS